MLPFWTFQIRRRGSRWFQRFLQRRSSHGAVLEFDAIMMKMIMTLLLWSFFVITFLGDVPLLFVATVIILCNHVGDVPLLFVATVIILCNHIYRWCTFTISSLPLVPRCSPSSGGRSEIFFQIIFQIIFSGSSDYQMIKFFFLWWKKWDLSSV